MIKVLRESKEITYKYSIYQISRNLEKLKQEEDKEKYGYEKHYMFRPFDELEDGIVDRKLYIFVDDGEVQGNGVYDACEELFKKYNSGNNPVQMRSMSVSDVIMLYSNGKVTLMYCDDIGFKEFTSNETGW